MLGKLFNLTAGNIGDDATGTKDQSSTSPSQLISSLESVQEDIHTRNLLFPDAESLFQHRNDQVFPLSAGPVISSTSTAVTAYDYDCDVFLDAQDVRVLIMQDALSSKPAALIYDSRPRPPATSPVSDRPSPVAGFAVGPPSDVRRGPISPRKSSMSQASRPANIQQDGSQSQLRQSAFDRRASMHGRSQPRFESETQRANREYADEINVFSSCIFGNSELMAYKGTSTKVHVVPTDARNESSNSFFGDGRGSLGRASMRSSKLSQSFSSEAVGDFMPQMSSNMLPRTPQRKKVLITRLFPVTIPNDDTNDLPITTPSSRFSEDSAGGFPFPQDSEDGKARIKRQQPKQKRTPMYAVALVINLPQATGVNGNGVSLSASRQAGFRGSSSYNENESYPSSFGSARRSGSGWTMVGQAAGIDSLESAYMGDIEDRIDPITQHWDIIMRTLTHLQSVVATKLFGMLRQHDIGSPDPMPSSLNSQVSRRPSVSRRRSDDGASMKASKTNARFLTLHPNCLMDNEEVTHEIEIAQARIVAGLRATRVVTGQNRWGIWREEARWVARWAAVKDQGLFFHSLLTGYLATHTDWLQALGPSFHRKRHQEQARARGDEDMSLPARTVIVARDKMAARRLVFLLAAFLPANQQLPISMRAHRPSTSASFGGPFSHSPPSYAVPILKEESLRRKINRRTAPRRLSHSRTASMQGQPPTRSSGVPAQITNLSMERGHERRPSDAISTRTTHLPISTSDSQNRKSSAATAATITPEATIPHFATLLRQESLTGRRPGSASSTAADDLKRTLQRGDGGLSMPNSGCNSPATTEPRPSSSTWGVLTGLWNARRRGSRDSNETSPSKRDSINSILSGPPMSPTKTSLRNHQELLRSPARLTAESKSTRLTGFTVNPDMRPQEQRAENSPGYRSVGSPPARENGSHSPRLPRLATLSDDGSEVLIPPRRSETFQRTPDPSGAFESPVKTSINIHDGVIDVDVQFPEYITSFETAISSPSSSGYLSTPGGSGLELFEQSSRIAADGDQPFNVAGWLQQYHPDFILQAIPPQADLIEQVKASLRAEPSPPVPHSAYQSMLSEVQQERWLDVSSVIIADTMSFSIQRIRYRRLVKLKPFQDLSGGALLTASSVNTQNQSVTLVTPAVAPYETKLEEEFVMEPIATLDDVLVEAVERVVGHVGLDSASSSRSTSKRRERSNSDAAEPGEGMSAARNVAMPAGRTPKILQEVPRAECKMVILSALEEVIKEVVERRDKEPRETDTDEPREKESELTVAVRGWLESVEMGE